MGEYVPRWVMPDETPKTQTEPTARTDESPCVGSGSGLDSSAARARAERGTRVVRCWACRFERDREIPVCPVCHPPAWLPKGCRARTDCAVVDRCDHGACGAEKEMVA